MKYLRFYGKPKKACSDTSEEDPPPKKAKTEFKQYPQVSKVLSIPPGKDDTSNSRNQKLLISEEKKINPNKHTISVLMDRTFVFRRLDITNNPSPVKEVLKLYPSLGKLYQVCIASFFNRPYLHCSHSSIHFGL